MVNGTVTENDGQSETQVLAMHRQAVRRCGMDIEWCLVDEKRTKFVRLFNNGLLTGVEFIGDPKQLACCLDQGPTGEITGELHIGTTEMPSDVRFSRMIVYDPQARTFHMASKPDEIVERVDYLLITPRRMVAGWK